LIFHPLCGGSATSGAAFFITAPFGSEKLELLNREDAKGTKKERRKKEDGWLLLMASPMPDARIGFISN
jgi:hypothetical protein